MFIFINFKIFIHCARIDKQNQNCPDQIVYQFKIGCEKQRKSMVVLSDEVFVFSVVNQDGNRCDNRLFEIPIRLQIECNGQQSTGFAGNQCLH